MEHKDVFLLETIVEYCDKAASYLEDNRVTKTSFLENPYYRDTCAFYCLQIGETANSLSDSFISTHSDIEWRNIINLRNIIAHEYGNVDSELLWSIIQENLPELGKYCKKLIK